ncbi:tetraspanin-10 [Hypomesus transpacificus]|uniref:tetraspanin-10 n=1 Tax=Hypomesus transpacificus TaxID=137520 RepID=UPI001F086C3B|nr:tetraspanin-10 [Hypomesus transpacificus]
MRRFQLMRSFPFPWFRRETTPNETSPLIPKADSDKEGAEAAVHAGTEGSLDQEASQQISDGHNQATEASGGTRVGRPRRHYSSTDYILKYLLFISNLLFTVLGLVVLVLGLWGLVNKESLAQEKIGSIGTDPMLLFVTVGFVLSVLCLSGCVGALRENCCLLRVFSAAVLVLVTAQVLVAIMAYSLQDQIGGFLRTGMLSAMARYQDDLDLRFITDEIQIGLQCCGADNYRDWEINMYYNCSSPGVLACGVPATCCVDPLENGTVWNSQCGVGAQQLGEFSAQSVIFLGGCLGGISRWVEQHTGVIGVVATVILGVQILTLLITTRLLDSIHWSKARAEQPKV